MRFSILILRCAFVLALLAIMPLLALPPVRSAAKELLQNLAWGQFIEQGKKDPDVPILTSNWPSNEAGSFSRNPTVSGFATDVAPQTYSGGPAAQPDPHVTDFQMQLTSIDRGKPADQLVSVYRRLRDLGATYTRLETIGKASLEFRFECRIPINQSVYKRTYEATAEHPLAAIQQVLTQVESLQTASRISPP